MKSSESIVKITESLLAAQKKMGAAKKGATNPFFHSKYADLGSVMEVCKDELNNVGITVLQPIARDVVETVLVHTSGEYLISETQVICKAPNDPQAYGGAISYARRYGLQSMLFIPAEDDDGEMATSRPTKPTVTTDKILCKECGENYHDSQWDMCFMCNKRIKEAK